MIQRAIQKLRLLYLRTSVLSYEKFAGINRLSPQDISGNRERLRGAYQEYTSQVSSADMAASLELAAMLLTACSANRYTRLLDLGSGLSSFVFRLYASEAPGVTVFSVDDDEAWLLKTRDFLSRHNLDTNHMISMEQLLEQEQTGFDCILYDLNFVETRINYVDKILPMIKPGGLIVFDDVHKSEYLFKLLINLTRTGGVLYSLQPVTLDRFGRYSMAYVRSV